MLATIALACLISSAPTDSLDLSGTRRFQLDPDRRGVEDRW